MLGGKGAATLYRAAGCHMNEKKESVLESSETKSALDEKKKKKRKAPGKQKLSVCG